LSWDVFVVGKVSLPESSMVDTVAHDQQYFVVFGDDDLLLIKYGLASCIA
jgi:hypothetical protein